MWVIELPLDVQIGKNKKFALNLNQYRNVHFRDLDKAKKNFAALATPLVLHLPALKQIQITYKLFARSKQLLDVANICSIVDKFFSDVLVSTGRIPDDNYNFLPDVHFSFGGVDRGNPRVEATIEPIGSMGVQCADNPVSDPNKETNMKVQLVQTEIETGIKMYLKSILSVQDGAHIDIELRATRGEEGFIANVDIVPGDGSRQAATASAPLGIRRQVTEAREAAGTDTVTEPNEEVAAAAPASPRSSSRASAAQTVEDENQVEGEAPLKSSIFSGLKRPNNAEAEATPADA